MKYKHIIFDIDNTLLDTEYAILQALKETIQNYKGVSLELSDLYFSMGKTSYDSLEELEIQDKDAAFSYWNKQIQLYTNTIQPYKDIEELLQLLLKKGYQLGVITSKNQTEYKNGFLPYGLDKYFTIAITSDDTQDHKPSPAPMLKYLELADISPSDALYIGDSIYDMHCAVGAKVDFGTALWGCRSLQHIKATYYFNQPLDVWNTLTRTDFDKDLEQWSKWAIELQFIAQAGITYSKDKFDIERFERIREISAEIITAGTDIPMSKVKTLFCNETGFQTPKLDTRAALFQGDKILLVQENTGHWSLPGGWVDVNQSIKDNTIKETKEEAGLDVAPTRLIALHDRNRHNQPPYAYGICKVFVLCELIGGSFTPNTETQRSDYFSIDDLPELAEEKNTKDQIKICYKAYKDPNWIPIFD